MPMCVLDHRILHPGSSIKNLEQILNKRYVVLFTNIMSFICKRPDLVQLNVYQ